MAFKFKTVYCLFFSGFPNYLQFSTKESIQHSRQKLAQITTKKELQIRLRVSQLTTVLIGLITESV